MKTNEQILSDRMAAFNRRAGARVGDWLKLDPPDPRCPAYTRFTHDWGDSIQTGGQDGSFYLGNGYLSYSGGLDPGISHGDLLLTDDVKEGSCWFFDGDMSGAGRGVGFRVPMRVFKPKPGAKLDGIHDLNCHWYLGEWTEEQVKERGYGYRFTLTLSAVSQVAFRTEPELRAWLVKARLALSRPLDGRSQCLAWPGPHWCSRCGANNRIVNECRCDLNNLPSKVP